MRHLALLYLVLFLISACKQDQPGIAYATESLEIKGLTPNTFVHTSYLQTESFGKVACNGLIFINNSEALVLDTPTTDEVSEELMTWITTELGAEIKVVVPTHSHDDCLGGLKAFHDAGLPSYANQLTQELAKEAGFPIPQHGFQGQLDLTIGDEQVSCVFMGEGHTKDNVIGYIPTEKVLFGGCLLKSLGASTGYIGEANVEEWPNTIAKIKERFQEIHFVVPGHGKAGGTELLDYTRELFLAKKQD